MKSITSQHLALAIGCFLTSPLHADDLMIADFEGESYAPWGHINVDHIVQTDTKPKEVLQNAERQFTASASYLHIPINNGALKRVLILLVKGKEIVRNDIEIADGESDWWAPMNVSAWKGKRLTLQVDKLHEDSTWISSIEQSDSVKEADDLYRESLRGQFHFSPSRGWNNDPNGMVFYNGEYHLFFQHNPYGWGWETRGGSANVLKLQVHELRSAWMTK